MVVIGLTGGIACGKSTISEMLINLGIPVIDSDKISRSILDLHTPAYYEVIEKFGHEIVLPSDHINRKKLGEIIFNDTKKRELLNSIIHPKVLNQINKKLQLFELEDRDFVCVDIPLMFETNMQKLCDFTICVTLNSEVQIERLMNRDNISIDLAKSKINSQMPLSQKAELADEVIDNSKSVLESKKQMMEILKKRNIVL